MIALDPYDEPEQIGEVQAFISRIGVPFPVGLERSGTYAALTQNFAGLNPFPVDVLIGKDGRIAYIAREFDPEAMTLMIERLLAE